MQAKTNEIKQWQLTAGLLAPLVATLLATAIVVIGFALWSAEEVDARSASRQTRVVANAISENLRSIPHGQESFALWDQAVGYTRLGFDREWVHLRKSNTEPIIRIYAESDSQATADHLANKIIEDIKEVITTKAE